MATQTDLQENLPLTEATFFILLSLAPQPKHGYAIMKEVAALSRARVVFSTGTLYGALKRLLEQGWIERIDEPVEARAAANETERIRKVYMLTELGRHILNAEVDRLHSLVAVARMHAVGGAA
jgi:DNA-binding PadR family transcriptional regulator